MRVFILLVLISGFVFPAFAHDEDDQAKSTPRVELTEEVCNARFENAAQIADVEELAECIDFFWHHAGLDSDFNKMIRLSYRIIEIDPTETLVYTTAAWLLASKWVQWKQDARNMPDGEFKMQEALNLLKRGGDANSEDADYFLDAGITIQPFARFHDGKLWPFVIAFYDRAIATSTELAQKIRAHLNKGTSYVLQKEWALSDASYLEVLKLDAKNKAALLNLMMNSRERDCLETAIEYADKLLEVSPTHSEAYLVRGESYYRLGRLEDARQSLEAAQAFDPYRKEIKILLKKIAH